MIRPIYLINNVPK